MIKTNHWLNILFALIFIVLPAFLAYFFWLPDFNKNIVKPIWFYWVVALSFIAYVFILSVIMYKIKVLSVDIFNFYLPLVFVLGAIFVSGNWNLILRFFFVTLMILVALPANMYVTKVKTKYRKKMLKKHKKQLKKK